MYIKQAFHLCNKYDKQGNILSSFIDIIGGAYLEYNYLGNQKYTVVAGLRTDYHDLHGAFLLRV